MIIFPMAGKSRRFLDAGYVTPKFMLKIGEMSVFRHAVESFRHYFEMEEFVFVFQDDPGIAEFVASECTKMGVKSVAQVSLANATAGQAETVAVGLQQLGVASNVSITIFNIDTFRPGFRFPEGSGTGNHEGFIEVFQGSGDNWSYVRDRGDNSGRVAETREKLAISNLCCTGVYNFTRCGDFLRAFHSPQLLKTEAERKERYVAPLYNVLIAEGADIRYALINRDEVVFCGVPAEYEELVRKSGARCSSADDIN